MNDAGAWGELCVIVNQRLARWVRKEICSKHRSQDWLKTMLTRAPSYDRFVMQQQDTFQDCLEVIGK